MAFDYEYLTDEGILHKFFKSPFIKGMKEKYGDIPEDRYYLIIKVIKHLLLVDYEINLDEVFT